MALRCRHDFFSCLLELVFPELCLGCGAAKGTRPWFPSGKRLYGLRPWDGPHLCAECFTTIKQKESAITHLTGVGGSVVPVMAAQWTNPKLVEMVGCWKYKGVRGLVWPLARLIARTPAIAEAVGNTTVWIPIPLHGRRARERGFNQALMLAEQLAAAFGGRVGRDLVARPRSTFQQAKLSSPEARLANLHGAFGVGSQLEHEKNCLSSRIIIVDDLVTSGATVGAVVDFLRSQGLSVQAIVCLGVAKPDSPHC